MAEVPGFWAFWAFQNGLERLQKKGWFFVSMFESPDKNAKKVLIKSDSQDEPDKRKSGYRLSIPKKNLGGFQGSSAQVYKITNPCFYFLQLVSIPPPQHLTTTTNFCVDRHTHYYTYFYISFFNMVHIKFSSSVLFILVAAAIAPEVTVALPVINPYWPSLGWVYVQWSS